MQSTTAVRTIVWILLLRANAGACDPPRVGDDPQVASPVVLFNGRDLEGWHRTGSRWFIQEGTLSYFGKSSEVRDGLRIYLREPSSDELVCRGVRLAADFELCFEWLASPARLSANVPRPSDGCMSLQDFTRVRDDQSIARRQSVDVSIAGNWIGFTTDEVTLRTSHKPEINSAIFPFNDVNGDCSISPGDWNRARVTCENACVRVWINGVLANTVDVDDAELVGTAKRLGSTRLLDQWRSWSKAGSYFRIVSRGYPVSLRKIEYRPLSKEASK
jgi:hypothetical protein